MKKLFLMGRSEAGKTSLTQALKGEELHYEKTQYTITADDTIDSPGEYAESKQFGAGLACFSFEADVVGIVQAADEPYNLFSPCLRTFILRPLIGIITKTDSPYANVPMIKQWLLNAGCDRIFLVNNVTRQRIPFIQPQMLFEFCLFHGNLDRIFGKVFHQFVNSLPGHVIYKKNTIAAGI